MAADRDDVLLAIVLDSIESGRIPLETEPDLVALHGWLAALAPTLEQLPPAPPIAVTRAPKIRPK